MHTILIGITGASSSGKSTLACLLKTIVPHSEIIHEDDFFKLEKDVPYDPIRGDKDWDCPDAIDFDAMKQTLKVLMDPTCAEFNPKAIVSDAGNGYYEYAKISTEPPRNDANFKKEDRVINELKLLTGEKVDIYTQQKGKFRIFMVDGFLILNDKELMKMFDVTLFFKTNYQSLKVRREKRLYTVDGGLWLDPPGYFDKFVWPGYYTYHKDIFINGNDESYIKKTGGDLLGFFKEQFNVHEFNNDDESDATELIRLVTTTVLDNIF